MFISFRAREPDAIAGHARFAEFLPDRLNVSQLLDIAVAHVAFHLEFGFKISNRRVVSRPDP